MKTLLSILIPLLVITAAFSQGVAINETGAAQHSSAILDVSSTKKGFLPPRMTSSQRDSIFSPADGLVIFNLTVGCLNYFFAGSWYEWCGDVTYPLGAIHCGGVPTAVVDVLNPTTGKTWMDRNLGATRAAINSSDADAYGDLYQWGRRADGHQCRNSGTTTTLSSVDQPIHSSFILAPNSPFDWRSPQNDNLWQGVNGINNPCPSGYRLPTDAELIAERLSWSSNNATGAINSPLKWPLAGLRYGSSGSIFGEGTNANYWSSSVNINIARILIFSSGNANMMTGLRADGSSVRCIKQPAQIQGSINGLDCNASTPTGTLTQGETANDVISSVPYTGGNGGNHGGQTVPSAGVTGLTATLAAGSFANGAGALAYTISGTPLSSGFASFALNIGGQTCTLTRLVNAAGPAYPAGTVHCTQTPTAVVEVLNPATGGIWMDRNLGASRAATSSNDAEAYGDLYQWGRRADGHQCRNSDTTIIQSSSDQPPNSKFIVATSGLFDWRSPQNDNLWQGVNGANNPCPGGYRLPTSAELFAEHQSWASQGSQGAFASTLKLPAAGRREYNNGSLGQEETTNHYWSSSAYEGDAWNLTFHNLSGGGTIMVSYPRAYGFSVRCIKETIYQEGSIQSLNCSIATSTGTITQGVAAKGVSSSVPYTGGNGGSHSGQMVSSTGVTGLTAIVYAGAFANGAGSLEYNIMGTPSGIGTASFALNIGGQTCTLTRLVNAAGPAFPAGTVHCTPTPTAVVEVVNPTTGRTWMDRNLGASRVATSSTDVEGYGDLYQWGRRSDGHHCRNSGTTSFVSSTDQPAHGNFILDPNFTTLDWRSPRNDNLWQGVNGVNNPCPTGYRIPTETELNEELLSWSSKNAGGAFASPLKFTASGSRFGSDGSLQYSGTNGSYWSSKTIEPNVFTLSFDLGIAFFSYNLRNNGAAVRCIKEISIIQGSINTLNCNTSTPTGTLTEGEAASGVSSSVPYSGGNGGAHAGQIVTSTGVSGLTATLTAGSFADGAGNLLYTISGTPASSGIASFALNIGGQTCTLTGLVNAAGPAYPAGTVHCTPTPTAVVEVVNPATGRTWMDRNLGASRVATSSSDADAYGDLYQWGRRADGHQCRNAATTFALSEIDQPLDGSFILSFNTPFDWRSPQNNQLWQGVNGVNNPCPTGFRLPTEVELNTERLSWSQNNSMGAFTSPLKLVRAGNRNSFGTTSGGGLFAYYWSSTVSTITARNLDFHAGNATTMTTVRADAQSVRCIKEMDF
jgi:uncharacterized protein (TIGR02145 family)